MTDITEFTSNATNLGHFCHIDIHLTVNLKTASIIGEVSLGPVLCWTTGNAPVLPMASTCLSITLETDNIEQLFFVSNMQIIQKKLFYIFPLNRLIHFL